MLISSDRAYLEQVGSFVAPFADVFYGPGRRALVHIERWAHLLAGEVLLVPDAEPGEGTRPSRGGTAERLGALEQRVEELESEVQALRAALVGPGGEPG